MDLVASVERGGVLGVHAGVKFCFFPDRHDEPGVFFRHYSYKSTIKVQGVQVVVQEVFHGFLTLHRCRAVSGSNRRRRRICLGFISFIVGNQPELPPARFSH